MTWISVLVALVIGFVLGLGAALLLRLIQGKTARRLAQELFQESEEQRKASIDAILENMKATFGLLSTSL